MARKAKSVANVASSIHKLLCEVDRKGFSPDMIVHLAGSSKVTIEFGNAAYELTVRRVKSEWN